ncbi:hypothetical protein F4819DRAFT_485188 [Hypoxylon fuscum]|nr:hypothetical protein F4819DRAFT_485188 [Hypoxylon fuscum]
MRKITPSAEQSSSKKILFLKTPSKGRRDRLYPMRVSVDAIFPITLDHEGRTVIHGAGNLAVVPYCINLAKWVHLPITLNFLCRYIRAHQAGPSQEELANLQAALIDDLTSSPSPALHFGDSYTPGGIYKPSHSGVQPEETNEKIVVQPATTSLDYWMGSWDMPPFESTSTLRRSSTC